MVQCTKSSLRSVWLEWFALNPQWALCRPAGPRLSLPLSKYFLHSASGIPDCPGEGFPPVLPIVQSLLSL